MDIYSFINSKDVAKHCREINHQFTPVEMAVVIGRGYCRPMAEKHAAWRELITDYPDMPITYAQYEENYESFHQKVQEVIDYEEQLLKLFKTPEAGAIYVHEVWWNGHYERSHSVFTTFEKAWADVLDRWKHDKVPEIKVVKINADKHDQIEVYMDYDGNIRSIISNCDEWFPHAQEIIDFDYGCYVDIPTPFKRGDILTIRSNMGQTDSIFVLDSIDRADLEWNMDRWGMFVDDRGVLYGDETDSVDCFEYYRGKLEGNQRLLHYVSLYLNDEIRLPELLTMQCRIVAENLLNKNFLINLRGCYISEHHLVENRLTSDEKEQIEKTNGVMPWIVDKLSIHQVEFLVREFGGNKETVQIGLANGGGWYMGRCAEIVYDENHYEKINDSKFNPARRDMSKMILEKYGHTEDRWTDKHASNENDSNDE